jgi:endoglucanase
MIPDRNIVWSFHSYAPFLLTHQGATWAGDFIPHVTGLPYPPHSVPRSELDAAVERIRETIRRDAPWSRRAGLLSYLDEQVATVDTAEELEKAMAEPFDIAAAWAKKHDVPASEIILGEFGMIRQEYGTDKIMPAAHRAAYYRDMIGLAEKRGFAWSMWDYGGAFGVVEEFDSRKAEPDVMDMVRGLR